MDKILGTSISKSIFALLIIFFSFNANAGTLPADLTAFKTLAYKYKVTAADVTNIKNLAVELSARMAQMTPEQVITYRTALEMVFYGMAFEAAPGKAAPDWTILETEVNKFGGTTAGTSGTKPTTEDFALWITYLAAQVNQYKILKIEKIAEKLESGDLIAFAGTPDSIVAKIVELAGHRMQANLTQIKTAAGVSIGATTVATTQPDENAQTLTTNTTNTFSKDAESPAQSWTDLKNLIINAKIIAGLTSNPAITNLKTEAISALSKLEADLIKQITFAERLAALVNLVAKKLIIDKTEFEIRLAKMIDGATAEIIDTDKKNIVETIDLFCKNNSIDKALFEGYKRSLAAGKKAVDIIGTDTNKTYALAWEEQDGTGDAQKYWEADSFAAPTLVKLVDNNPLKNICQFKIEIDTDPSVIFLKLDGSTSYLTNNGKLAAKAADGTTSFFVFGSKDALSLKSKTTGNGFVTVKADKTLATKNGDEAAGSMSDAGILEPGTRGVFKLVEITQLHKDLAVYRKEWLDSAWDASTAAKTLAQKIKGEYQETISNLSNDPKKSTDVNAELIIRELSAFITKAFRGSVNNWSWFNTSGLSLEFLKLFDSIKNVFAKPLMLKGQAAKAMLDLDKMISTAPEEILNEIAQNDGFDAKINFLKTELQRYENNEKEDIKKLLDQKKIMPFIGEGGLVQAITDLMPRRTETALENLKTKSNLKISTTGIVTKNNDIAVIPDGHKQLKTSLTKSIIKDLEDPTCSWDNVRELITLAKSTAFDFKNKAQLLPDQINILKELFFSLSKQLDQPISTTERVLALKKLVETEAIKDIKEGDIVKITAKEHFEIRLLKLIDSLAFNVSTAEKKALTDTIDRFCVVTKDDKGKSLDKDLFKDYIRILTQGRHPSEIFSANQVIALLWTEQDGTEPVQKYWSMVNKTNVNSSSAEKIIVPTETALPNTVKLIDNDSLNGQNHFKVFVTDNSEIVLYANFNGKIYLLKNDGSLVEKQKPSDATDTEKFYAYGSKEAISFKSIINLDDKDGGFVTVDFNKTLKTQKNNLPLGKKNTDGSLEPGLWGLFKVIDITPLHTELKETRANWFAKDWVESRTNSAEKAKTEATNVITAYRATIAHMDNEALDSDFNVELVLQEIIRFIQTAFRTTPEQWDWFKSSELEATIGDLKTLIKKNFAGALGANGQATKTMAELEINTTVAPEESLAPHEDAPKNGQALTFFIEKPIPAIGMSPATKKIFYLRVVQETDAQGNHYYLKADVEDPVDSRCHFQVTAQGNKLGFGFKDLDGTVKTLQHVKRQDSDLKRLWQDDVGKKVIKRMTRLEFLPAGAGELNSKARASEQFMMEYHDTTKTDPIYLFNNMAEGAGALEIDAEGYAVDTNMDMTTSKLIPAAKTDALAITKINFLPISGFLTELGLLRTQKDPHKAIAEYTAKIDIVQSNQDIEFLIMEFENFIEAKQTQRKEWTDLTVNLKFIEAVQGFIDKIATKVGEAESDMLKALKNLKNTYAQTVDAAKKNLYTSDTEAKVFAIKWINPDGATGYLLADALGNLTATAETFNEPACHFSLAAAASETSPLEFKLKLKSNLTEITIQAADSSPADIDYLNNRILQTTATSTAASATPSAPTS